MNKSIYEVQMAQVLHQSGFKFETEYRFDSVRKWRFDFLVVIHSQKIAIEVEGEIWTGRGRHSKGQGFINDCEKYNSAQIQGYMVLRYAPDNLPNVVRDLDRIKLNKNSIVETLAI